MRPGDPTPMTHGPDHPAAPRCVGATRGLLLALLVQSLVFFPVALLRLIDGDEGFYLLAARLVAQGQAPYRDFLYPQMPLLPYVYGLWSWIFGLTWAAGRCLSALLAVLTGGLLYRHVVRLHGKPRLGLLAVLLYCLSGLCLGWFTVVKTHSLAAFLLFGSFVLLHDPPARVARHGTFLSGILLGLAMQTRLLVAAVVPAMMLGVHRRNANGKGTLRRQMPLVAGLAVAALPSVWLFVAAPREFVFSNLGYHALRSGHGLVGDLGNKLGVALTLIGVGRPSGATSFQTAALLVLNVYALATGCLARRSLATSFGIVVLLGLASFLPTPTFLQYFAVIVPFLVLNAVALVPSLGGEPGARPRRKRLRRLLVLALGAYLLISPIDVCRFLFVHYSRDPAAWRLSTARAVASEIDRHAEPGEPVLAWWPGYLVESHAAPVPGMENHFGQRVAARLSPEEQERHHILPPSGISSLIAARRVRLVVLGNQAPRGRNRPLLEGSGYAPVGQIANAGLYLAARGP